MSKPLALPVLCLGLILLAGCGPGAGRPAASPTPPVPPIAVADPTATRPPEPSPQPSASAAAAPTAIPGQGPLIALDPGHGGEDLGARHFNLQEQMDLHESTVTLAICLKIGQKLKALGYRVFYTRDGDYDPNPYERDVNGDGEINLRDVVQARTDLANQSGADLLLSIHMNAWETKDEALLRATGGTETYYCPDRPFGEKNLRLATLVHQNLLATLARVGDEVSDRNIHIDHEIAYPGDPGHHLMILGPKDEIIVRPSNMPGMLSEPMFITCDREAALMARDDVQDALAQAYVDAVVAYFTEFPRQ